MNRNFLTTWGVITMTLFVAVYGIPAAFRAADPKLGGKAPTDDTIVAVIVVIAVILVIWLIARMQPGTAKTAIIVIAVIVLLLGGLQYLLNASGLVVRWLGGLNLWWLFTPGTVILVLLAALAAGLSEGLRK